jgi:uncharacterized protein (TIGR02597 family)
MKIARSLFTWSILLGTGLYSIPAGADEVFSGVAGYSTTGIPADRDLYVSVPFVAEAPQLGAVSLIGSLDSEGNQRISIEGVAGLEIDSLSSAHSVRLLEGVNAGLRYPVVSNEVDSMLVAFGGEAPSPGVIVALERCWTLDTLFPPETQSTFHESTGKFATSRGSELMIVSPQSQSGLTSAERIYFLENGAWIEAGGEYRVAGTDRIPADAGLVIRHPASVPSTNLELSGVGYHGSVVTRLQPGAGTTGSAAIGLLIPGGTTLSGLGLGDSEVRPGSDLSEANRRDVLHVFALMRPNAPAPAASYFRSGGSWRTTASGNAVSDDAVVPAGSVLVIENVDPADAGRNDWDQTGGASAN